MEVAKLAHTVPAVWIGIDAGKEFHWAHALDDSGRKLLSRRVENDEADLSGLIDEALSLAEEVVWAVDQPGGGRGTLARTAVGERPESPLHPGPHCGPLPRHLPWRIQDRCPRCPHHCRPGSYATRP